MAATGTLKSWRCGYQDGWRITRSRCGTRPSGGFTTTRTAKRGSSSGSIWPKSGTKKPWSADSNVWTHLLTASGRCLRPEASQVGLFQRVARRVKGSHFLAGHRLNLPPPKPRTKRYRVCPGWTRWQGPLSATIRAGACWIIHRPRPTAASVAPRRGPRPTSGSGRPADAPFPASCETLGRRRPRSGRRAGCLRR